MKGFSYTLLICAMLSGYALSSCGRSADRLTFETADIINFDDYTDTANPYIWLDFHLDNDTASYTLVLQLTLPAAENIQDILGNRQSLVFSNEAAAFHVRPGYRDGTLIYESYLIKTTPDIKVSINPVTDGNGTVTISKWNGYDADEVGSIGMDISVRTDEGETLRFNYSGPVSLDFINRVRARSKNPACAGTNLFFRNLSRSSADEGPVVADGTHIDFITLSNDDATRSIQLAVVMPEDASVPDTDDLVFAVSDAGKAFSIRPGMANGFDGYGSFVVQDGVRHAIGSGKIIVHRPKYNQPVQDIWRQSMMEGVFTDDNGTEYNFAFISKPDF